MVVGSDEYDVGALATQARQFQPIQARQLDVEEQDARIVLLNGAQRRIAISGERADFQLRPDMAQFIVQFVGQKRLVFSNQGFDRHDRESR